MKKIFCIGILSLAVTFGSAAASSGPDYSSCFESANQQFVHFENKGVEPVAFDVTATIARLLNPKEQQRFTTDEGFSYTFNGKNYQRGTLVNPHDQEACYELKGPDGNRILQKRHITLASGESIDLTLSFISYFIGLGNLTGMQNHLSWDVNERGLNVLLGVAEASAPLNQAFVTTPSDWAKQTRLYRQYFLPDSTLTTDQVWQDFESQPSGVTTTKRTEEVVFTLTSYPARFATTWLAIESLLRQEEKPDRIVLNLFEGEFPGRVLPWMIKEQMKRGLEINWCPENFKVYLKVIPTIQKFPEAAVVAVDDDVIYPNDRLKNLIAGYKKYPECIIAQEVRETHHIGRKISPCSEWNFTGWRGFIDERELGPSYRLIAEGVTGVLIPPKTLHEIANQYDLFKSLTPTEDDLWLYSMALLKSKKTFKIRSNALPNVIPEAHNMACALSQTNTANGYKVSSECFSRLFAHFHLGRILEADEFCLSSDLSRMNNSIALTYGEFTAPRSQSSPVGLLRGFSWTEAWERQRDGVWTDGEMAYFSCTPQNPGLNKITVKSRFFKHENNQSVEFRIKKDGVTLYKGEFTDEWFDFSFVDFMSASICHYTIEMINLNQQNIGFSEKRRLGILFNKISVETLTSEENRISLSSDVSSSNYHGVLDTYNFVDLQKGLTFDGAGIFTLLYAQYHAGLSEEFLRGKYTQLIKKAHTTLEHSRINESPIPLIHHRAWHTSLESPKEPPEDFLHRYIASVRFLDALHAGWKHIFWVNSKAVIPNTMGILEHERDRIEVREVNEFPGNFLCKRQYEALIADSRYTNANDIFRVSLIHAVGGIYCDLGLEIVKDIHRWMQCFDAIFFMYPSSGLCDHNLLAAKPNSKFLESYILRLLNPKGVSKKFIKTARNIHSYWSQHVFCGGSGIMSDILERFNYSVDQVLLVPEGLNGSIVRKSLASWFSGNHYGNKPVEESKIDFLDL
ncbi:MAG TPA: hypothetical protein DIC42_00770 [Holosporales bacterium]|nr:hypothetical protein [Holosporales bacterium]